MDLQLTKKTALVTGATAGIGLAIAKTFAREGVEVTITGRSQGKLAEAAGAIKDLAPAAVVHTVVTDLATPEGAQALTASTPAVDILVNNLGFYEAKPFADITDDDWTRMLELNVMSGVRLSRHYFPLMLKQNWGRVIFISSEVGAFTPPDMVHYGVSKSAQLAVARGMAEMTKGTQVTVNSVLPAANRHVKASPIRSIACMRSWTDSHAPWALRGSPSTYTITARPSACGSCCVSLNASPRSLSRTEMRTTLASRHCGHPSGSCGSKTRRPPAMPRPVF